MRNVAIINATSTGSTGKIAIGLYHYLNQRYNKTVFCSREQLSDLNSYRVGNYIEDGIHIHFAYWFGLQGFYSIIATLRLLRYLSKNAIDTIYVLDLHERYINEPIFYRYIAKNKVRLIYLMIDEYAYLGKCCFSRGCDKYITKCGGCPQKREFPASAVFDWSRQIYKMKSRWYHKIENIVFVGPQIVIDNGIKSPSMKGMRLVTLDECIDTSFFYPRDTSDLKKSLKITEDKFVCVCIAPYSGGTNTRKGVEYYIELARQMENDSRYVFVQVGYLLEDKSVLPSNYIALGFVKDQETLAHYYSLGDLFVFPSVADSMPNTCLEAMACGSPLLCFDIYGMTNMAPEGIASYAEPRNVNDLKKHLTASSRKDEEIINRCRNYALARYDNQKYFSKLENIANELGK